jgi:hypothetical protein
MSIRPIGKILIGDRDDGTNEVIARFKPGTKIIIVLNPKWAQEIAQKYPNYAIETGKPIG